MRKNPVITRIVLVFAILCLLSSSACAADRKNLQEFFRKINIYRVYSSAAAIDPDAFIVVNDSQQEMFYCETNGLTIGVMPNITQGVIQAAPENADQFLRTAITFMLVLTGETSEKCGVELFLKFITSPHNENLDETISLGDYMFAVMKNADGYTFYYLKMR